MYFDTHAHYDDEDFDIDRDELIPALKDEGVELVLNAGCRRASCEQSIRFAERYDFFYAAVGWHPHDADSFNEESEELIRSWAKHPKVKAIGEIGLDFHYDFSPRDVQRRVLIRQMELAEELSLPVIIHDREAHGECLDIIKAFPNVCGVMHCYSGSAEMARELISLGWYLGFNGAITFKNARKAIETLEMIPEDRFLLETDCPYLTPVPHRGKRNDSRMLSYVAQTIGRVRGISGEEAAYIAMANGKRLFGI